MKKYTYKLLHDLPAVPEHFVQEALELTVSQPNVQQKNTTLPSYYPEFKQRVLSVNGQTTQTAHNKRFILSEEFQEWVRTNISSEFVEASVAITNSLRDGLPVNIHGAHTDWSRNLVLMYLLETGGDNCQTVFYQEKDRPIWREDVGCFVTDYDLLTEIDAITIPKGTWCVFDTTVLHGVLNLESDRIAVQVGLRGTDQTICSLAIN
jgi:hypothetical protein